MNFWRVVTRVRPQPIELLPQRFDGWPQCFVVFTAGNQGQHSARVGGNRRKEGPNSVERTGKPAADALQLLWIVEGCPALEGDHATRSEQIPAAFVERRGE